MRRRSRRDKKKLSEASLTYIALQSKKSAEAKPTRKKSSEARQMMETRSVEVAPRQTRRARGRLRHSVPPTRLRLVFLVWLRRFAPPTCRLNRLEIIDFFYSIKSCSFSNFTMVICKETSRRRLNPLSLRGVITSK